MGASATRRTTEEQIAVWKAVMGHVIALLLVLGLLAVILLALVGAVDISNPTVATFMGTATGYLVGQLGRPLAFYFSTSKEE